MRRPARSCLHTHKHAHARTHARACEQHHAYIVYTPTYTRARTQTRVYTCIHCVSHSAGCRCNSVRTKTSTHRPVRHAIRYAIHTQGVSSETAATRLRTDAKDQQEEADARHANCGRQPPARSGSHPSSQFRTEKCQFRTEKCQFRTEKCQFRTTNAFPCFL